MTSQFREDEHIAAVLNEIGDGSKILADIGARYALSNSEKLIRGRGYTGVLIEANEGYCKELTREFPTCTVVHRELKAGEVNEFVPKDVWFLSIDIDSYDFWVWANLTHKPALVVVETNPRPGMMACTLTGASYKDGYGMSVDAARWLGEAKGYDYLGRTEANAFFVRKDLKCSYRLPELSRHAGTPCGTTNNIFA